VATGQFEMPTALTGLLAGTAAMDVPAIAMLFELGLGNVCDDVVIELTGRFEVVAAAMSALLRVNLVLDELGAGRRAGTKDARVPAVLLESLVVGSALTRRPL